MDEARGVLEVWQLEHALVERVESEEGEGVIVEIEAILKKVRSFYELKKGFYPVWNWRFDYTHGITPE